MKTESNPMQMQLRQPLPLLQCRKCAARTRSGAPTGKRNGAFQSGRHTKGAIAERQKLSALLKVMRASMKVVDE